MRPERSFPSAPDLLAGVPSRWGRFSLPKSKVDLMTSSASHPRRHALPHPDLFAWADSRVVATPYGARVLRRRCPGLSPRRAALLAELTGFAPEGRT